jgi:hypothetical protein
MARATPHLLGRLTSLVAVGLAACLGHPATAPPPLGRDGVYTFAERIARTAESIAGKVVVLADTITVESSSNPCRYDADASREAIAYACAGFGLWFDRRDPVGKSIYRARRTVMEPRAECTRLDVRPNGDRVCLIYADRPAERTVDLTGPLHLVSLRLADSLAAVVRPR